MSRNIRTNFLTDKSTFGNSTMPIGSIVPIFKATDDKVTDNGVVLNLGSIVSGAGGGTGYVTDLSTTSGYPTTPITYDIPATAFVEGTDNVNIVGVTTAAGHILPQDDGTSDLGTTSVRWRNVYADTFVGDGSNLTGVSGFATALNSSQSSPLFNVFKTPRRFDVGAGTSITVESDATSGNIAFMRNGEVHVAVGSTFHIGSGTTLVTNVLSIF